MWGFHISGPVAADVPSTIAQDLGRHTHALELAFRAEGSGDGALAQIALASPESLGAQASRSLGSPFDDLYQRVHLLPAEIDLGLLADPVEHSVELWQAYVDRTVTITALTGADAEGIELLGPGTGERFGPNRSVIYTLRAGTDGPPVISTRFAWTFDNAEPVSLSLAGFRMRLWPLWPQGYMNETRAWQTHIFTATDGSEQRRQLRDVPRWSFQFDSIATAADWRLIQSLLWVGHSRAWGVPLAHQVTELRGVELVAGTTVVPIAPGAAGYRVGGLLALRVSADNALVAEIERLNSDAIVLKKPLERAIGGAGQELRVCPVEAGYLTDQVGTDWISHQDRRLSTRFDLSEAPLIAPVAAPVVFAGVELLERSPVTTGSGPSSSHNIELFEIDFGSGKTRRGTDWTQPKPRHEFRFVLLDDTERSWLNAFLDRRCGSLNLFWAPSHAADFVQSRTCTAGASQIEIENVNARLLPAGQRHALWVEYPDGTTQAVGVTGISLNAATGDEVLALEAPLTHTADLPPGSLRLSVLLYLRLQQDSISQVHAGTVTECTFNAIEVPRLGGDA